MKDRSTERLDGWSNRRTDEWLDGWTDSWMDRKINRYLYTWTCELSPKFKCCKMEYFFSFGLKVPFGFPCLAHVCLSNSFGFVCFSTAYVTLVVALLFGSLVLLPAFLQGFIQSASVPPLHYVTLRGGRASMFLRVDGRCF